MQVRILSRVTQKPYPGTLVALVALICAAWLSLVALEQSPYGQLADHAAHTAHSAGHVHVSTAGGASTQDNGPMMLLFFTAGWALMVVAMMVPVMLPSVMRFSRSIAHGGSRVGSVILLIGGYVLAWTAFGIAAHLAVQALPQAIGLPPGMSLLIGPAALILAGAYQFSPLKRRYARGLCSPPVFVPLPGAAGLRRAHVLMLGLREGALCIGCCWALMLLMLVGVAGGTAGMLVLGTAMYVEKNATWGHRWIMPLGLFLIGLGIMLGWGTQMGFLNH